MTENEYIAAIAPGLAADAAALPVFLDMARQRTNAAFYGAKYAQAVALLAAHLWVLTGSSSPAGGNAEAGSTGSVASKREGDLSISYSSPASALASRGAAEAEFAQTRYGLQLLALRKGCGPFIEVPGDGCGCR